MSNLQVDFPDSGAPPGTYEQLARLAAIVDSSDDAIISKDLHSIVTTWNAGAQKIFGYTPEEMIGSSIMRLIPPDRHDEEDRILSQIRQA